MALRTATFRLAGGHYRLDLHTHPAAHQHTWVLYELADSGGHALPNPVAHGRTRTSIGAAWAAVLHAWQHSRHHPVRR